MNSFDYSKLRGRMAEKGFTQEAIAQMVGMSPNSFCNKITGKNEFRQSEMRLIMSVLDIPLSDAWQYFFAQKPLKSKESA